MEKKGLGKGLGALIPGADREERVSAQEIEIRRISFNPYQPRDSFDQDKFAELVNSVRVHGILQPIVVRSRGGGEFELVAGERRLRAATEAGLTHVPAVVRELSDEQSLQIALIENIQREDINPVDAALAYRRLMEEFGLSQEDIALGLGKSRSSVANTLRLLNLSEEVRSEVKSGRISEGHARAILSVEDPREQEELCRRVVGGGLSVRETERMAREWAKGRLSARDIVSRETNPTWSDPNLAAAEAQLRGLLGTKVSILRQKDRGRIEIEFYSDEDLERLLLLLTGG